MIVPGDTFVFPLTWKSRDDILNDTEGRALGAWGMVIVVAGCGNDWLVAAVEWFGVGPESPPPSPVTLARHQLVAAMPHITRSYLLAAGDSIPAAWTPSGRRALPREALDLGAAFVRWRSAEFEFESGAAYEQLGGVDSGLSQLSTTVASEWRRRFELDLVLATLREQEARNAVPAALPTWAEVSNRRVTGYPGAFGTKLEAAWAVLIHALAGEEPPQKEVVMRELRKFLSAVANLPLVGDYHDELGSMVVDVAAARGVDEKDALALAETILS
jgi:hypothetical protein